MLPHAHSPIYLDYAATTPVDPRVLNKMLPFFSEHFGNPASVHRYGQRAEAALEAAREKVAGVLGCQPGEVIFTSCGSESDNLALRGVAIAARHARQANHILISPVEHHAVSKTARQLEVLYGFEVEILPVDEFGRVRALDVEKRLRPTTALVSVIYANNEIGTINPIPEIGAACQAHRIAFHTDAVQAGAFLPVNLYSLNVDLLSIGAHKFYGPKGIGALGIKSGVGVNLAPTQTGGGQEFGLRAGTHNVSYIIGLAEALELAQVERDSRISTIQPMRDYLIGFVLENVPDARLTGHPQQRLPNHASFVFRGVDGNMLLMMLDNEGFACSSGSACKTGSPEPSEVLTALGLPADWALGSLRVTLGVSTTAEQVEQFANSLPRLVEQARRLGSVRG